MNENLGPIHYMMYEKIKFQDEMTAYLMDGNTKEIDKIMPAVSTDPLDKIIDQENIHGYLSSKIDVVENRLSMAFAMAENIDQKLFDFGKSKGKNKDFYKLENIIQDLNIYLLDGMPCDKAISLTIDDNNDLYLITNNNLHSKYQTYIDPKSSLENTCQGDHDHNKLNSFDIEKKKNIKTNYEDSFYHKKRLEFLKGYFSDSAYEVSLVDGINYRIYKKR
ncbi:MAG: hypothetical protein PUG67_00130 [Peptoniphilaceae bacterium]|nr:hypothetical protein [Peptoniphilaceae bacterium]MDY6018832.1 hypothetical protein [Anaerococcus sp.]